MKKKIEFRKLIRRDDQVDQKRGRHTNTSLSNVEKVSISDLCQEDKDMIRDSQFRRLKNNPNLENIFGNGNGNSNGNAWNGFNGNPCSPYSLGKKKRFRDENINIIEKGFEDGYNFEDEKSLNESPKDGDESRYVTFDSDINVLMYISHHS